MVPQRGIEPLRRMASGLKPDVSASSTTGAYGAKDGHRTRAYQSHNLALYQLSYPRHMGGGRLTSATDFLEFVLLTVRCDIDHVFVVFRENTNTFDVNASLHELDALLTGHLLGLLQGETPLLLGICAAGGIVVALNHIFRGVGVVRREALRGSTVIRPDILCVSTRKENEKNRS